MVKEEEDARLCDDPLITCHRWSTMAPCADISVEILYVRVPATEWYGEASSIEKDKQV